MESGTGYSSEYIQYQNNRTSSGLLKFRSAPGSFFDKLTDGIDNKCAGGADSHGLSSRFGSSLSKCNIVSQSEQDGYGVAMNSQLPPQYPRQISATQLSFGDGGYVVSSNHGQAKMGSNLMRLNSSPAGLFSLPSSQNDYGGLRGVEGYRFTDGDSGAFSPSSGLSSSLGMLSRIPEVDNENCGIAGADEKLRNEMGDAQFYSPGFPFGSWSDSSKSEENFYGIKTEATDGDAKSFNNSQSPEHKIRPTLLSHHLSLPKTSAEIAGMEKLLHLPDAVPCKIRAKRGFATHPRSIAERVRRTRISERMKKLQDLVPNMDKQTSTADMLDLAAEYIKDLRKQYKTLADIRANCKCSALQKPAPN